MNPDEHRIVSLIASSTEIICALGFRDQLVGCSHECDFPPSVESVPACSAPRIDVNGTSREIDDRVKAALRTALSVYEVDSAKLEELRPTTIITQTQCDVCAVNLKDVEAAVCELVSSNPQIVSLEPNALADVWEDFRRVGAALDAEDRAEALVTESKRRLDEIAATARGYETKPTVACIEWVDPLMSAGNWVPELVEIAGGENLFGEAGKHSPWMTFEQLLAADPDVIVTMPCGFGIERTLAELPVLTKREDWGELRAVRENRVFVADGNQYFNRPGPRLVESTEILMEILHGLDFGFEGVGWRLWRQAE